MKRAQRGRIKPWELLLFAGLVGVFAGLITIVTTRNLILALIVAGVGFIITLVVFATLLLAIGDDNDDTDGEITKPRL